MPQYENSLSPIRRRNPIGLNIGAFNEMINALDAKSQQTAQQQSAIDMALAQLPVNAAEDEWRYNLGNDIRNQIESVENPNDKYLISVKAAGQLLSRPDVIGRIRAQADYDNFVKQTQARKDLTEDDKSWALAMNPYKYEDKLDNTGRIIGGTEWKATVRPVGEIDYNKLLATAKQLVFKESGGSTNVVFYDSEGRDTDNPLMAEGVKYYKNGTWEGIDKNKLTQILEAAIDNEPGARARLEQDWNVANWKYDQLSEEEKVNNKPSELFASNGKKYTKQEWYNNKFGRAIDSMSGMNNSSTIKYDDDYSKFMAARRLSSMSGNIENDPFSGQINIATGLGTPALIQTENDINKAFGKVESGMQDLEKIIPHLDKDKLWVNAKNKGDYNEMANIILGSNKYKIISKDPAKKQLVDSKLREFKDNASLINSVRRRGDDFQAIAFNGAFTTGGELPSNNEYTKKFMNYYNSIGGKDATKLEYSFIDEETRRDFMEAAGITEKEAILGNNDNLLTVVLPKSNTKNYKALCLYRDFQEGNMISNFWRKLVLKRNPSVRGINEQGDYNVNLTYKRYLNNRGKTVEKDSWADDYNADEYNEIKETLYAINNLVNTAQSKSKATIGNIATNTVTTTTKHMELPGVMEARVVYADDPSKQNSAVNEQIDKVVNNIIGMNGSQYEIMAFDPNTNTLSSSNIKDRTEALENVKSYLLNDTGKNKYILGLRIIDGKIGYRIQIPKQWDKSKNVFKDGDIQNGEIVIFNPDDPYLKSMENDSKFIASARYDKLSRVKGATHHTYDDNIIKFDEYGNAYVNGQPEGRDYVIGIMDKDEAYNQLKLMLINNITANGTLTPNYANTLAQFVSTYYGYDVNTPANIEKAADLINQMQNELKY